MTEKLVTSIPALHPGDRLLCGPGPSNVNPAVLEAMRIPMNGHLDPDFWDILLDLTAGLKALWRRADGLTLCFSASGTSGMEAGLANLTEPGDKVIVIHAGFFGARIAEMAKRAGTETIELTAPLGRIVLARPGGGGLARQPRHEAGGGRPRRDLDRRALPGA